MYNTGRQARYNIHFQWAILGEGCLTRYYYEEYERNHKEGRYFSQTNTETALLSKIFIQTNEDAWTKASVVRTNM